MNTDPDILDPTETDRSELIIDPETITQWVDKELPTPHMASVDTLSEKFPSLKHYGKDAENIRALLQESFKPTITAPANTLSRVLSSIKEEEETSPTQDKTDTPAPALSTPSQPEMEMDFPAPAPAPFVIEFPVSPKKKKNLYLMPAAALLFLMALVGAIIHSEMQKDEEKRLAAETETHSEKDNNVRKDRKTLIMSTDPLNPHSEQRKNSPNLANYDLTKDALDSQKDKEKDKDDPEKDNPTPEKETPQNQP